MFLLRRRRCIFNNNVEFDIIFTIQELTFRGRRTELILLRKYFFLGKNQRRFLQISIEDSYRLFKNTSTIQNMIL